MELSLRAGAGLPPLLPLVPAMPSGAEAQETNRTHMTRTNPKSFMTTPIVESVGEYGKIFPRRPFAVFLRVKQDFTASANIVDENETSRRSVAMLRPPAPNSRRKVLHTRTVHLRPHRHTYRQRTRSLAVCIAQPSGIIFHQNARRLPPIHAPSLSKIPFRKDARSRRTSQIVDRMS